MDLTGPHQVAAGGDSEHVPAHLAPARLVVAGPPRPQRIQASTGLGATDVRAADAPVGIRRRLILDAAIVLGGAAALVLAVSIVAPTGPSGGVLGITTDGMATAGTIIGPGPVVSAPRATQGTATQGSGTEGTATQPTGAASSTAVGAGSSADATGANATRAPSGISVGPSAGPSAASLALLARCVDRADCYLYLVRRGDNLTRIATRFGVAASRILTMNPTIVDPSIIVTGTTIRIPTPTR